MLLLHTDHGAVQLLAKQTSQTHGVKAKRALVIVQCCEEKRFFPVIPCTPVHSSGPRATKRLCCHYSDTCGEQICSPEDNLMAWMWQGTAQPSHSTAMTGQGARPGPITLVLGSCRRHRALLRCPGSRI